MAIETVFLDAGGVLVVPNWARVSAVLAQHGVRVSEHALTAAEPIAKHEIDVGSYIQSSTDDQRWTRYFDLVLTRAGVEVDNSTGEALDELRHYHEAHNLWEVVPQDVQPALARLRSLGLRLVVVSNSNGTVAAVFERLGLASTCDLLIDSHVEGVEKPDPRLFQIALVRSGARANRTLHIGDLYHVDVMGARAAGLHAALLDPADLYRHYICDRVRTLSELADKLANKSWDSG